MSLHYDGGATISQDKKTQLLSKDDTFVEIEKLGRNSRRIQSKIRIETSLDTVWNILTDYEKLTDFIPALTVSKVVEKKEKSARVYQLNKGKCEGDEAFFGQEFQKTLSYSVDVKPKMWLPVHLVEGRLSREIKMNLSCIREESKRATTALSSPSP